MNNTTIKTIGRTKNLAIEIGPSGCGKFTAIHYIALQLKLLQDYEIIIVYTSEEIRLWYNPDNLQIFVIDDVFGAVTFNHNKAMKWLEMANDNKKILADKAQTDVIRDRFICERSLSRYPYHSNIVVITLEKETKYVERLNKDIEQGFIKNVFSNSNLKDTSFRDKFITHIAIEAAVTFQDDTLFSLLMSIMDKDFCDIVCIPLKKEIDLNQIYWDGETPLFKFASKGYNDIVELLLKQHADPNFRAYDVGNTAIESVAYLFYYQLPRTTIADVSTDSGEQASDISPEEENYLRTAHLLIRVAPSAVRVRFDTEFSPGGLKIVLNQAKSSKLEPLKKRRVINQAQWDLLFPKSGTPSSETFDLTLMICLIRNLTKIQIEDELPFMGNDVVGADLTTIKYYRNKIMQ
ncbi:unnamed protein product [Mytilus coruscus]|uniref:Uncharacterized protein n=1 Tax=Mytilus coruscus TaxID=42192 RepID=A0A6J8C0I0_MYTCO|nr:unnamed protein product [Mytilus coruscus]